MLENAIFTGDATVTSQFMEERWMPAHCFQWGKTGNNISRCIASWMGTADSSVGVKKETVFLGASDEIKRQGWK